MLESLNFKQLLFLDIETVPQYLNYESVPETTRKFWDKKSEFIRDKEQTSADIYQRAGIYAEFGKVVCISAGVFSNHSEGMGFKLKSFCNEEEKNVLQEFAEMLENFEKKTNVVLCAHNGKEFDFPYLSRRFLINGLSLPRVLDNSGKKPWEITHIDTLELWKFGDYKNFTSLDLLTHIFGIPSPKEEIDGSMVADVFYKEKDLDKIKRYCENDVLAVAQLILKLMNKPMIHPDNVVRA